MSKPARYSAGMRCPEADVDWVKKIGLQAQRGNDRMLRDAGLSPVEALGPSRVFWAQWQATRQPWRL